MRSCPFAIPTADPGQERMAQVTSHENPLLERGDIYFLYRPEVGKEEVHGPQDVQRVYTAGPARHRGMI